ncbi:MAG: ornithine cyclodeaminase family protein [Thermoprotei archaeon]
MTLFISERDVDLLVNVSEAIEVIEEATKYQGQGLAKVIPRKRILTPSFVLNVMAASIDPWNVTGLKAYLSTRKGTSFIVVLFDTNSSELVAIIEADRLGQLRTGAASGVASKYMGNKDASTVGIIGAGRQARTQAIGIAEAINADKIFVYSRTHSKAVRMVGELKEMGYNAEVVDSYSEACKSDIISTVTNSSNPFLKPEWIKKGTHINLVGSNMPSRAEAFPEAISLASLIVTDLKEQAMVESGDLIIAVERGLLKWEHVRELWEVVLGNVKRKSKDDITIFKSNGIALWDVALAKKIYEKAIEKGLGIKIEFKGRWEFY